MLTVTTAAVTEEEAAIGSVVIRHVDGTRINTKKKGTHSATTMRVLG